MAAPTTPEETRESARRLLVLAEFLEKLPPERFNFSTWVGDDWKGAADLSCGTVACALGWATAIPEFAAAGLHLETVILDKGTEDETRETWPVCGEEESETAACAPFLLTWEEADFLFHSHVRDPHDESGEVEHSPAYDASAAVVAAHIRRFVAKHRAVRS